MLSLPCASSLSCARARALSLFLYVFFSLFLSAFSYVRAFSLSVSPPLLPFSPSCPLFRPLSGSSSPSNSLERNTVCSIYLLFSFPSTCSCVVVDGSCTTLVNPDTGDAKAFVLDYSFDSSDPSDRSVFHACVVVCGHVMWHDQWVCVCASIPFEICVCYHSFTLRTHAT